MTNIINTPDGDIIGFEGDLIRYLKDILIAKMNASEWEDVQDLAGVLAQLDGTSWEGRLLIISENNGMGYTINQYKGE